MVPSRLVEESLQIFFGITNDSTMGGQKTQTDPQRTPKAGVSNDLPHYYDEDPERAPFVRISVYSRVIVATFSLSFWHSFAYITISYFFKEF